MRHNLLIVDDEELIRQGLKARFEYLEIDTDEIFEASSGVEAIEAVNQYPIDVVITDIRMPDMDGLTLIREIQKLHKDIQFVVLSGYAEFSYAETAIRLGVKAYLLKPLSNEELKVTLQKLYDEMERNVSARNAMRMQKKLDLEKQEYCLEKEINTFFSGTADGIMDLEHLCRIVGADTAEYETENQRVFLAVINVDPESYENKGFRQVDHELIRFSIKNVFREVEAHCGKLIVNSLMDYNQMYAVFFMDDEKRLRNEIERIFLKMRSVLEKKMDIYLTFGVSRCAQGIRDYSVKEAQSALKQRIVYGNSNLYFHEDIKIFSEQEFPVSQLHLLNQYIERNEIQKIKKLLLEIFSEDLIRKYGTPYLKIMWVRVLNMIFHYYDNKANKTAGLENLLMNFNLPDQIQSISEIQQRITEIIVECVRNENVTEINARSRIKMAVRYIQEHYNENIAINDLAGRYGMSPNYFSSIFKKEMNQSTVNYITELRIKKAQEFLEHSEMSVVDIAKNVGYEDSQYFFRVFKKYIGMTPLNYREQYRS